MAQLKKTGTLVLAALVTLLATSSALPGRQVRGLQGVLPEPSYPLAAAARRLQQATATAVSSAEARKGGTARSDVTAGAVSTGAPATATSVGEAKAGPGQVAETVCNVFVVDSAEYKKCVAQPVEARPQFVANTTATAPAGSLSFESAPACTAPLPAACTVDTLGRCWGFEDGRSCAYKSAQGGPLGPSQVTANATAAATAGGAAAPAPVPAAATEGTVSFAGAPACEGDPATGTQDASGRFWGYQNGASCAFKDAGGYPRMPVNPAGSAEAGAQAAAAATGTPAPAPAPSPSIVVNATKPNATAAEVPAAPAPAPAPSPAQAAGVNASAVANAAAKAAGPVAQAAANAAAVANATHAR